MCLNGCIAISSHRFLKNYELDAFDGINGFEAQQLSNELQPRTVL